MKRKFREQPKGKWMTHSKSKRLPSERYDVCVTLTTRRAVVTVPGSHTFPQSQEIKKAQDLPLIVRQNQMVQFEDQCFELKKEGLYRFANWGKVRYEHPLGPPQIIDARQSCTTVILFKKDILKLFGAIAALAVHGHTHDSDTHEQRLARMKLGGVALTCGSIAQFMCRLLSDLGYRARVVQCLRTEGVYDTYDCGHLLFEFFWPKFKKWVLADIDTHRIFVSRGVYLSMVEVMDRMERKQPVTLEPLTLPGLGLLDTTEVVTSDFTGMALFNHTLLDTEILSGWYRRMFAAVSFASSAGIYYCPDPQGRKRIARNLPTATFVDKAGFLKRHYGMGS